MMSFTPLWLSPSHHWFIQFYLRSYKSQLKFSFSRVDNRQSLCGDVYTNFVASNQRYKSMTGADFSSKIMAYITENMDITG